MLDWFRLYSLLLFSSSGCFRRRKTAVFGWFWSEVVRGKGSGALTSWGIWTESSDIKILIQARDISPLITEHVLQLLVAHFILLKFAQLVFDLFFLFRLFHFLDSRSHRRLRYVFTILQGFLTSVDFPSFIFLIGFWHIGSVLVYHLNLLRKLLRCWRSTCILSSFFFFSSHSSPPMLAPSPPNLVHSFSFSVFFLSRDRFKLAVVVFLESLTCIWIYLSSSFSCLSLSFLSFSAFILSSSSR